MSKWDQRLKDLSTDKDLIFQTLDWHTDDLVNDDTGFLEYKIFAFGVSNSGSPVTLTINGFYPFFFIEVPSYFDSTIKYSIREAFTEKGLKSIKDIEFLKRKKYYGFENNKIRNFLKLSFYSGKGMRTARYIIKDTRFRVNGKDELFPIYEANIDPLLRFTHISDILTAGWINIKQGKYSLTETESFECLWTSVTSDSESIKLANIRILYFDIEACSEDGSFPNALKKNDRVTQICCIIKDSVLINTSKYIFNLGTCDLIEDTEVIQCKSEKELLLSYARFIIETDPDIIVGYNIFGFDNGYLFERAQVLKIESKFNYQSKLPEVFTKIEEKELNNQQSGFNKWKMTRLVGRLHIDLLQVIKKDFKLESYKLNNVGEHFLGEGKDDVTPSEIFEAWSKDKGTREKRTRVGKYCVQDTNLCLLLFEKFAVLANHIEMAKVTRVPIEYLITRGQSIKVFSQIAYETRKAGFLIPVLKVNNKDSKFQGATVLDAKTGYYQRPVAGLDFASLYPSIMIAHNMCYSTVVLDSKYSSINGIEYSTIDCGNDKFSFVQNQPGVLSGILESLWKQRKVTKKEMNNTSDPFTKTVLNAKQLAIKVSMNSIYGFTGAVVGALPCLEISQSVTGCGRLMIEQTSRLAIEKFNCEVIYGDSVTSDTPVLIRKNNKISIITIEDLFNTSTSTSASQTPLEFPQFKPNEVGLSNKQQVILQEHEYESWTTSGWKPIRRVIRHLTNKRIFRVTTNTGIVDVTEDHSLLDVNKREIKPELLFNKLELFHSYPSDLNLNLINGIPEYIINYYNNFLSNSENIIKTDNKLEAAYYFLLAKRSNKNVKIFNSTRKLSSNYTNSNSPYNNTYMIFIGDSKQFKQNNKKTGESYYVGTSNDYVYDIETEDGTFQAGIGELIVKNTDSCYVIFPEQVDSDGTLRGLFKIAEHAAHEISKTFKKPIELEFEKFMYPLILSKKKKYIYVEWTKPDKHNGEIEAKGMELVRRDNCQYVKDTLESVLNPIMFQNNLQEGKNQAQIWIDNLISGKVDIKKLILSKNLRNDYKGYVKEYSNNSGNSEYRWKHIKEEVVKDSISGKNVKTGKEIVKYECPTMAHVALVEKMIQRDPNSAPKPGDRVPFVYVTCGDPKALAAERVEDPGYVISNNLTIDYYYYFLHQLHNPLENLFNIILGESECKKLLNRPCLIDAKKKEKISIGDFKRKKEGNKDIRQFFNVTI